MTPRTITSPYDPQTQAEMRAWIGTALGQTYANMDTALQTEVDRIIDASGEYITKTMRHEPWALHEIASQTLASGTATVTLAAAVRHVVVINETYDSITRNVRPSSKMEYMQAWGDGSTTHPWATSQSSPRWFFDGMDDSNPPLQQWKRVPTPDKAITYTVLARPYMTLMGTTGDTQYTHLPANAAQALKDYCMEKVAILQRDWEGATFFKRSLEDEIAVNNIGDNPEGAWEGARLMQVPEDYLIEMDGP